VSPPRGDSTPGRPAGGASAGVRAELDAGPPATGLRVELEAGPPATLPAGKATAAFCFGTCFHRHCEITRLELLVDGIPHPLTASAMPRRDLFSALHPHLAMGQGFVPESDPDSEDDPEVRSYRSGFWATVIIGPRSAPGDVIRVSLRAGLEDGSFSSVEIARVEIGDRDRVESGAPRGGSRDLIAVCMSTFNPDMELFRTQVESLRAQTDTNWVAVVSDDCSRLDRFREIEAVLDGDERFSISRAPRRLGFYLNFERSLSLAPPGASLFALCDQDDYWYPEKLATLRGAIGNAMLVYSDQRLVDTDGVVEADTYWTSRRNNHTNFLSMLIANTVTGAASLMRREVVEGALPFPEVPGEQYHDHWLALVAMALGDVAYVDRPLYDYVQHGGAALGHAAANAGISGPGGSGGAHRLIERFSSEGLRRFFSDSRGAYFRGYVRLAVLGAVLLARFGDRMGARKRRALRRFIRAERSPLGIARLAVRSLRSAFGYDETLGVERLLVRGILWHHLVAFDSRGELRPNRHPHNSSLPPPIERRVLPDHGDPEAAHIQRMIEPIELSVSDREPQRINLLIPTIDLKHLFGGYIAKFNLARKLAESGHRVRVVAVDPTPPLPSNWRQQVEAYSGMAGAMSNLEVAFARDLGTPLPVHPDDRFVATTWWTAHHARNAIRETNSERFLYLIQEYEPFTFVMGSWAAIAKQTYDFPHLALFSTTFLRDWFAEHGEGVYARGIESGNRDSVPFQNAITPVLPPALDELRARETRKLLFYARAEPHAKRNLFELGLIAISDAIEGGVFGSDWQFFGIGSVEGRSQISLPRGMHLDVLNRQGQAAYGEMLAGHDVGLSLMFTPHPSLVPIEMASAGLLTVTNTFDTKTAEALESVSGNMIAVEPTIEATVAGLATAVERTADAEARITNAHVEWPSSWERSFDPPVMARIETMLSRCQP